jgi:hypothetical protein
VTRRLLLAALVIGAVGSSLAAQTVSREYRAKAAYLFNFVKYVEWPDSSKGRILICVAGQNPFGTLLESMVRNERVRGLPLATEVILEARSDCDVLFTPRTANIRAYLLGAAGLPTLTVGETPRFVEQGGMIGFYPDGVNVRFEINPAAATRVHLKISSQLLQLAKIVGPASEER